MKVYRGYRTVAGPGRVTVTENSIVSVLDPEVSLRVRNHSPTGFNWGYGGSGPAQLSLALLLDHFGSEEQALRFYQRFKFRIVAALDIDSDWQLTSGDIDRALMVIEHEATAT